MTHEERRKAILMKKQEKPFSSNNVFRVVFMVNAHHHHHHFISFHKSYLAKQCHRMRNMSGYTIAETAHNVEHITLQIQS
jgi:hypothetical protein